MFGIGLFAFNIDKYLLQFTSSDIVVIMLQQNGTHDAYMYIHQVTE